MHQNRTFSCSLSKLLILFVAICSIFGSGAYIVGRRHGFHKGIAYTRQSVDPLSDHPILIFQKKTVSWNELAKNIDEALIDWAANTERAILGTFPVPGNLKSTLPENLHVTAKDITFPSFGEYYLRTTLGNFKILLLDPKEKAMNHLRALATFVSRNSVHSLADGRLIQPNLMYYPYHRPDKLLKKFFTSDQPVALHCGYIAELLNYLATQLGFKTRRLQLYSKEGSGHIISQIFLLDEQKWVMIDPDYGAIIEDERGHWLSIEEIVDRLQQDKISQLEVVDLVNKHALLPEFDPPSHFVTQFTWTPQAMSHNPMVVKKKYLDMMEKLTHKYIFFDYDDTFQWINTN